MARVGGLRQTTVTKEWEQRKKNDWICTDTHAHTHTHSKQRTQTDTHTGSVQRKYIMGCPTLTKWMANFIINVWAFLYMTIIHIFACECGVRGVGIPCRGTSIQFTQHTSRESVWSTVRFSIPTAYQSQSELIVIAPTPTRNDDDNDTAQHRKISGFFERPNQLSIEIFGQSKWSGIYFVREHFTFSQRRFFFVQQKLVRLPRSHSIHSATVLFRPLPRLLHRLSLSASFN